LRENATSERFTAFSISSTHRKMMIALRRTRNPATPPANRKALSSNAPVSKPMPSASTSGHLPPRQDDRADHRHEEQHGRHLERDHVVVEQGTGDHGNRAFPRDQRVRDRDARRPRGLRRPAGRFPRAAEKRGTDRRE